jgi:hypothetical protein
VFFVTEQEAVDASIRLGPNFTLHGATAACKWLGGTPQEMHPKVKYWILKLSRTLRIASRGVLKRLLRKTPKLIWKDRSFQKALDSFYSRGRKSRSGSGVTRKTRRNPTRL